MIVASIIVIILGIILIGSGCICLKEKGGFILAPLPILGGIVLIYLVVSTYLMG